MAGAENLCGAVVRDGRAVLRLDLGRDHLPRALVRPPAAAWLHPSPRFRRKTAFAYQIRIEHRGDGSYLCVASLCVDGCDDFDSDILQK